MPEESGKTWVAPEEELWVTKDGQVLEVGAMTEEHARNALRVLICQIRKGRLVNLGYHQEQLNKAWLQREVEGWDEKEI